MQLCGVGCQIKTRWSGVKEKAAAVVKFCRVCHCTNWDLASGIGQAGTPAMFVRSEPEVLTSSRKWRRLFSTFLLHLTLH